MALVSAILRRLGIRIDRYLDDLFIHYCREVVLIFPGFHSFSWLFPPSRESRHFSLKDLFFEMDGLRSLGPFVAAGVQIY